MTQTTVIQCQLKLRPTCAQESTFKRWLWHLTAVYNWTVKTAELEKSRTGRTPSAWDLRNRLPGTSQKIGVPKVAIEGTVFTARQALGRYQSGVSRKPKLKGRRRPLNSIALSGGVKWNGSRPCLPLIGPVRVHRQEVPSGHCGSARIIRRSSGWYLCLFIRAEPCVITAGVGEVGIDPGFKSLLALSTGELIDIPSELQAGAKRLAQAQRGGRKRLTARIHERIGNRRKNRNHHLSRQLVSENRLIAFSKDRTSTIARRFGKSVTSAGHSQLRMQLRYKSLTGGTEYIEVDSRNSTRTCSVCGAFSGPTGLAGLSVRHWTCRDCGSQHERDVNAAQNTLIAALGMSVKIGREAESGIAP